MKRLIFILPLIVFIAMVGFFAVGLTLNPRHLPSPLIGKPAPEFTLPRLKAPEETIEMSDLKGKVSLVNVWATWCANCLREHPVLMHIAKHSDVPLYGMDYKDERGAALEWLKRLGDPYAANAYDADGRVGLDWGVYGAPETFLLDRNGIIRHKQVGEMTLKDWQESFQPLIRELKAAQG